ncbi:MAG: hypothetical protein JSV33_07850 [bacterium]|nr:MAG: hypothetical protein JSV33_07850 [bacterium]
MFRNSKVVPVVACAVLLSGLYVILRDVRSFRYSWAAILTWSIQPRFAQYYLFVALIPSLKIIAGIGLFWYRPWARALAVPVCGIDFIFRFVGMIKVFRYDHVHMSIHDVESWRIVKTYSLWPSYVIAAVSIVALILLITVRFGRHADRGAEIQQ